MKSPAFWYQDTVLSRLLSPLSALYGHAATWRHDSHPYRAPVAVICVGNATVGGAGKTPVALALGKLALAQGTDIHFLSKGYGGRVKGPLRVDPSIHVAAEVGDEPLILATVAPTWIARDRAAGARAAVAAGARLIVMDDGLQNPHLVQDMSLLVVDAAYGFGNGKTIPAGPLREPVEGAVKRCHAIILVGEETPAILPDILPVIRCRLMPRPHSLEGKRVVAFAGIGRPVKFRKTLEIEGVTIVAWHEFADHHPYDRTEIVKLRSEAAKLDAILVTTEKDFQRLPRDMRDGITVLFVDLMTEDPKAFHDLLDGVVT
jgi:tetraacyldisaccharide 4'-kinase